MQLQYDKAVLPSAIVIFGASGDLTQRKLVPALVWESVGAKINGSDAGF